jgi:LEA14-like dessication related protein
VENSGFASFSAHYFCIIGGMLRCTTLLAFLVLLGSCGKMKEPEFRRLEGFQLKNVGLSEATIRFQATYYNPNNFGVTVKETALDVRINDQPLGRFTQTNDIQVDKAAEFSIPLEARIGIADAIKMDIPRLIGKEVMVQATGTVRVGKGGVYVTRQINYSGKQLVDPGRLIKNPAGAGSGN